MTAIRFMLLRVRLFSGTLIPQKAFCSQREAPSVVDARAVACARRMNVELLLKLIGHHQGLHSLIAYCFPRTHVCTYSGASGE